MRKSIQILILIGLLVSLYYLLISPAPKYDIYDNEAIIQEGDSYFSTSYQIEALSIKGKDFSGTDTLLSMDGGSTMQIYIDLKLSSGQLRLVWITPDEVVHELNDGTHLLTLSEGTHRIKVVGSQASFEVTYQIQA